MFKIVRSGNDGSSEREVVGGFAVNNLVFLVLLIALLVAALGYF